MNLRSLKSAAARKIRNYVSTAWLKALFPHTGPPDEFANRLQRIEASPFDVGGDCGGQVTCRFIYPEVDGTIQTASAKFFIPPALKKRPDRRVPLLHMAGYEIDESDAAEFLKEGIVVSTVHGSSINPLSRGPKLEWALMHAMRRLPFIDDTRVFAKGISAGANMALLLAAETFPMACALPNVPLLNWSYNLAYFIQTFPLATSSRNGSGEHWVPILAKSEGLPEQAAIRFGANPEDPAYFELSPVRITEYITAPVAAFFSTGDVLAPVDQISPELNRPFDASAFPEGLMRDMALVLSRPDRRVRLFDVLPEDRRELLMMTVPNHIKLKTAGGHDDMGAPLELPFSRTRQWSIVVAEEGGPEPAFGHFKHEIAPDFTAFRRWAFERGIQAEQLTPPKLTWLMKRFAGVQPLEFVINPIQKPAHPCHLLDFPQAERADVLRGLMTYARTSDAAARRMADLYASLPANLKAFGETLGTGSADSVRHALEQLSAEKE